MDNGKETPKRQARDRPTVTRKKQDQKDVSGIYSICLSIQYFFEIDKIHETY